MKNTCLIFAVTALSALAQTTQSAGIAFQQAGAIVTPSPGGAFRVAARGAGLMTPSETAGSPFSATEQTHSLQVLGDGTRIERSESQQVYRDSMGRTRVESAEPGNEMVTIQDPVEGFSIVLNKAEGTVRKVSLSKTFMFSGGGRANASFAAFAGAVTASPGRRAVTTDAANAEPVTLGYAYTYDTASREKAENLATQNVNGVMATGHRSTMTIPAGEIGNDRPIQVVSESWFSGDLGMVVKSSSSDPRFGDTSFEVTNIVRGEPDPSLFQVPPGYSVTEGKAVTLKAPVPRE